MQDKGLSASVTTSIKSEPTPQLAPQPILTPSGTKCRVISVSAKYMQIELLEPTNLQNGQEVVVSKA